MARLKAQADILYYPTAEPIVRLIATWFSPPLARGQAPTRSRLADPCCGKGEALATFAQAVGGESETWGVEISYSRAEEAQRVLDVVLPASFYAVTWGQRSVSLAFDNPPYDWSSTRDEHGRHLRHEWLFVSQMTPRIVPGGHHVILVPRSMLADERFARHLVGWYRENLIFRSGEDYDRFKQVVILAAHRKERYEPPTKDAIDNITGLAEDSATIPELVAGDGRFVIPVAPQAGRFQYQSATPEDLLRAAARCEVVGSDDYDRATYVRPPGAPINVAVPEKIGHMTMEISSGEVGVLSIDAPDGPILMKGMSSKAIDESAEAQYDDEGEYSHTKIEARERLVTIITVAHPDGTLERLDKPDAVGDFITRHAGAIADALLKRNRPTYDWRPTVREWDIASRVALGLPPLPGRETRGLFDAQKHFAIAAARVMRKYRQCLLNCDMGWGKTSSSIGALEVLDEWPVLVLCPGHMVEKWRRDLERAGDPDDPIAARIITRPARGESSRWYSQIMLAIEEAGGRIVDTTRTQVAPVTINDPGGRRRVIIECVGSSAARLVIALQSLCTFRDNGHTQPPAIQFTGSGLVVEFVDRDDYTLFDFATDYRAGHLGRKAAAVIAFDPAKYDAGPVPVEKRRWQRVWNEEKGAYERQHLIVCPTCGKGHATLPWRCDNVIQEPILDASGKKAGERSRTCDTPLYEMSRWRRVGLSRLIQRKFKRLFKVYIGDECFPADTPIATPQGNVPIQAIRVGDEVLTEKDGVVTIRKVSRLYRKPLQGNLVKIVHTDGELVCTPNHRIYVNGEFVRADALLAGDELTLVRMHDDHQALQDVREPLPGAEFPTTNMPTDLRQATRGAHARRHSQLPCVRQRVHRNQDQGQATNDLQSDLWREVSSHARNSRGESQTWSQEATHIPDLPCVRTTIREHSALSVAGYTDPGIVTDSDPVIAADSDPPIAGHSDPGIAATS